MSAPSSYTLVCPRKAGSQVKKFLENIKRDGSEERMVFLSPDVSNVGNQTSFVLASYIPQKGKNPIFYQYPPGGESVIIQHTNQIPTILSTFVSILEGWKKYLPYNKTKTYIIFTTIDSNHNIEVNQVKIVISSLELYLWPWINGKVNWRGVTSNLMIIIFFIILIRLIFHKNH